MIEEVAGLRAQPEGGQLESRLPPRVDHRAVTHPRHLVDVTVARVVEMLVDLRLWDCIRQAREWVRQRLRRRPRLREHDV